MPRPSLRTIAVAAGLLGVTMIVAGTATAMTQAEPDVPIAKAVTVDALDTPVAAAAAAQPVEVGLEPIRCSDEGACEPGGGRPDETEPAPAKEDAAASTVAREPAPRDAQEPAPKRPKDPARKPSTPAATAPPCDMPEPPANPEGEDWSAWKHQWRTWFDQARSAAQACGLGPRQWREAMEAHEWGGAQTWGDASAWPDGQAPETGERADRHGDGGGERLEWHQDGWAKDDRRADGWGDGWGERGSWDRGHDRDRSHEETRSGR
ncbi:hypothetical protein [Demequina sp. NBRC 110053]|uniref:hypothetical protein n=1 Tax=Demequina sp. NBRC 110053 TaxID=1570342 RepID=UPI001356550A|nr:hypothetical protein [Demequina sp. NBRC 110053]